MAQVKLEGVGKVYPGDVTAVTDFNLDVADGEFVVLVGPSGCGKTTLAKTILQIEKTRRLDITEQVYFEIIRKKEIY